MAEGSIDVFEQTECSLAIEYVASKISHKFPQYPSFAAKFKIHCMEEAFEEIEVLIDDVAEGFDESVILEAILEDINITHSDKEPLCQTIYNLLSTYVPPYPEPSSLDLREIYTTYDEKNDLNPMKKLVSSQVKLLEPTNKDTSIYKVLIIGQKNNFPLLTYLVCSYQRYRLSEYFKYKTIEDEYINISKSKNHQYTFEEIKLQDFIENCNTMIDLENDGYHNLLLWYKNAMKSCIHRNGIFYILPLLKSQIITKINDSLAVFQIYFISLLLCINNMIKEFLISYPNQIDIWIIPKNITFLEDDDAFLDEINDNFQLKYGLKYCLNLQQYDIIIDNDLNLDKYLEIFTNIIKTVLNNENHKRMCIIIDRRGDNNTDKIYAYLPKNTHTIPSHNSGQFLYESMVNLTKKEIFILDEKIINGDSDTYLNMFIISFHMHKENEIGMYWHYRGSVTRFYVCDMVTLWPSHFIINEDEMDTNSHSKSELVQTCILNNAFDKLIDINFQTFYEINTGHSWIETISPIFIAKPNTLHRRRNTNEVMEEKLQQYKKRQEAEEKHRLKLLKKQKSRKMLKRAKSANNYGSNNNIININGKSNYNEGDIKINDEIVSILDNDFEFINNKNKIEIEFMHVTDFDKNGLLYFLGTYALRKSYINPALIPLVSVNASSLSSDSKSIYMFVGRECVRLITDNTCKCPWMMINIHPIYLKLSKYTLKHHNSHNAALLNWTLEASNDGIKWIILKVHSYDESLNGPGDTFTWDISYCNNNYYFNQFRIVMTDKNNSGRWYLGCSGIELYGHAFGGLIEESLKEDFDEKLQQEMELEMKKDGNKNKANHNLKINHVQNNNNGKQMDQFQNNNNGKQMIKSSKTWNNIFKKSSRSPRSNCLNKIKWNIYVKEYKKCVHNKGKIIHRLTDEFNKIVYNTTIYTQFMFGSSLSINKHGFNEFKIKYESEKNEYCLDAVGITSDIYGCKMKNRWITNTMDDEKVNGIRYVYWGGGKIYSIHNYNEWKNIIITPFKWKNGQILTVQIDCVKQMCWYITFLIDNEQINEPIKILYTQTIKYYPIISTQCDDAKFTIV